MENWDATPFSFSYLIKCTLRVFPAIGSYSSITSSENGHISSKNYRIQYLAARKRIIEAR
jgi:hypothetical protein